MQGNEVEAVKTPTVRSWEVYEHVNLCFFEYSNPLFFTLAKITRLSKAC